MIIDAEFLIGNITILFLTLDRSHNCNSSFQDFFSQLIMNYPHDAEKKNCYDEKT